MAALFQKRKKEPAEKAPVEAAQALQETIVCPACGREINKKEAEKNLYVCYECGSYFRVRTRNRIRMMADAGTFTPWFEDLAEANPLEFPGYEDKVKAAKEKTGLHEAVTIGRCKIYGEDTVLGICDARFLMSSDRGRSAGHPVLLLRWRQNAGGDRFPDADGKNICGIEAAFGSGTFVCSGADRSYHRRCDGKLCHAWGYYSGGAGSTHRLCGTACD